MMDDTCSLRDLIKNFDAESLENYLHELIDYWLQTRRLRYNKYIKLIGIEDWWRLEDGLKKLAQNFINNQTQDLDTQLNELEDETKSKIKQIFNVRKLDLIEYFKQEAHSLMNNYLNDFDWSIKHAISSNKLSKLNETLCTLKFYSNNSKNEVECEMNKDELNKIIEELEKIDKIMDNF